MNNLYENAFFITHNEDGSRPTYFCLYSLVGHLSFRSTEHGTWYINALVDVFGSCHDNEDVMSMLLKVNDQVTQAYTDNGYRQCPAPVFTLTKKIYF